MGVFDDWMKGINYTIEDIMNKKLLFTQTEFMTCNHCQKQITQIISKQRGEARVPDGDVLRQSQLRKIARINFDNTENSGNIWVDNSLREVRNRTKITDQLPDLSLGLKKDVTKDDRSKKLRTTLQIMEIHQFN
ncbi:MAG: hypothetical protein EZS28_012337 [Streblomastix strix]|uniref:Uncharacterized protein n=1 Tax=Streblomastix strix TaxID=222440 RepID=A0A5J4WC44_9EUKA|nr:MAG: hypothetical protein EZS28_012337 [Streblomastix strix]